ncbi:MAG: DUF692 domain-containing protein [Rubricoccaceae bacterium]|nr:DUF692 domain-containing protein [Rubricoccaceae bacterium]
MRYRPVSGAGLGLRRSMMNDELDRFVSAASFLEVAPENWIGVGGRYGERLRAVSERIPLVAHGLSLSVGGIAPLDRDYLDSIGAFLAAHQIEIYSEHLSFTDDGGQLYDLLPLPFTDEAVAHVSSRIRQVQDTLERKIALENVSYYLAPQPQFLQQMNEAEFITTVLEEADCELLLDINNVYVNGVNHGYDPSDFIRQMPADRIRYYHVAGHYVEDDGLIIDTHAADVIDPVWKLLAQTYERKGVHPTLLERDFNIPGSEALVAELGIIGDLQRGAEYVDHKRIA